VFAAGVMAQGEIIYFGRGDDFAVRVVGRPDRLAALRVSGCPSVHRGEEESEGVSRAPKERKDDSMAIATGAGTYYSAGVVYETRAVTDIGDRPIKIKIALLMGRIWNGGI